MKASKISLLFCLLSYLGKTQALPFNGVIYRDTVPLFIKSQVFSGRNEPKGIFTTISSKVIVSVAEAKHYLLADQVIQVIKKENKTVKPKDIPNLEYRIISYQGFPRPWILVGSSGNIIDTKLEIRESFTLEFRIIGHHDIIQRTTIQREDLVPTISDYKIRFPSDTVELKEAAKSLFVFGKMPNNFHHFRGSLTVPAGKVLDLVIDNPALNQDSLIEYRLFDQTDEVSSQWIQSGHLMSVTNLVAKHEYSLFTRYKNGRSVQRYGILVLAYWWQEAWAIAIFILVGILVIALVSYLAYRNHKERQERQILLWSEKSKTGQNKLDTHWIDNMFHTLMSFIRSNQNEKADQYLGRASTILRNKLIYSENLLIPLIADLDILEKFIANEQLKFPFIYSIQVDPGLALENLQVPPSLWQPSLENSIKHGEQTGKACIIVKVFGENENLVLSIADNGRFQPRDVKKNNGFGIPITRERVDGLNMTFPEIKIQYEVIATEEGTLVQFIFENWLA